MLDLDFSVETLRDGTIVSRARGEGDLDLLALFLCKECRRPYAIRRVLNWLPAVLTAADDEAESHRLGLVGGNDVTATVENGIILLEAESHATVAYPEYCELDPKDFEEALWAWMKFLEDNGLDDPKEMAGTNPLEC